MDHMEPYQRLTAICLVAISAATIVMVRLYWRERIDADPSPALVAFGRRTQVRRDYAVRIARPRIVRAWRSMLALILITVRRYDA